MYQRYIICSNGRESEEGEKVAILCHICDTKPSINPLTTDLKKICLLASSEFFRHFTDKTGPITLTVLWIKPLGNLPHTRRFIEIIVPTVFYSRESVCFSRIGGLAQMVERSLSMWEVPGSMPGFSRTSFIYCSHRTTFSVKSRCHSK